MSDFGEARDEGNGVSPAPNAAAAAADRDAEQDLAASIAGDSVAGTNAGAPANPRKRKKSSRASVTFSFVLPRLIHTSPFCYRRAVVMMKGPTTAQPIQTTADPSAGATFVMSTINHVIMPSHGVATVRDTTSRVST